MTLQKCPEFESFDVLTSASVFRHKNHAHAKFEGKVIICLRFIAFYADLGSFWGHLEVIFAVNDVTKGPELELFKVLSPA